MRKTIWAALPLALLALAAPAAAKDGVRATTYKAHLAPLAGEAPAAAASKREEKAGVYGKAELVDGRRDKVQVRVRGLVADENYSWSVRQAAEGEDACAGEAVDAFEYAPLEARRKGSGKARARSRAFAAEDGAVYAVVVTDAEGADIACGEFARKGRARKGGKAGNDDAQPGERDKGKRGDRDSSGDDEPSVDDDLSADGDESGDDLAEDF